MTNLAHNLVETALRHPDRVAIRLDEFALTFADLVMAAHRVAAALADASVVPGDRVAVSMANVPAFPVAFYGALMAGAVVVPMNPQLRSRELDHYLADSGATVVLTVDVGDELAAAAARAGAAVLELDDHGALPGDLSRDPLAPVDVDRDSTAVILYTSGTTGRPKGAELTHRNLDVNARTVIDVLIQIDESDVVMGCLPLFHVFGLTCGLNAAVVAGACLTLVPRFDGGAALAVIGRDRVTVFQGVPTMYVAMLRHPDAELADLTSLRTCITGGAAMPVEVLHEFENTFACEVYEGYGLSETSPVACFNQPGHERRPGSVGFEIPGCTMRVVGEDGRDAAVGSPGEIAISGVNIMKGYWNRPDATAEAIRDGWFYSGDLGIKDIDGYFSIVDRKKDMILRGGYNIYPREIEEVLYEHPAVAEAAVVGIPHVELGEEVLAAVVLRPGSVATAEDVRAFVKERVAGYKYPRIVELVTELPKGPTGKILRREVRADHQ